ncbi:MAG: Mth938-like domain-containing protein [Anaerolineales bacterium]
MSVPKIEHYRFAEIVIDGEKYTKDVIIYPDRVQANWWRESGHNLIPEDMPDVLASPPEVLVIGRGSYSRMDVPRETKNALQKAGIQVIAQSTGDACQTYNRLAESRQVMAALHLTC